MTAPTVLESAVFTLLGTVPGAGTVFGLMAPQTARPPFVIYQRISGERFASLTGPSGLAQARIQVDTYDPTFEGAKTIAAAIRQALDGYSGTVAGVRIGGVSKLSDNPDQVEAETDPKSFRCSQDFLFTYEEV